MTSKTYAVAVLISVTATAWVGNAFATQPGNNGGGNGGCGVGQQTNGCGTSSGGNTTGGSATSNAGAIGIGVGMGGAGGSSTAYGGSGGKGGEGGSAAVIGSGNSSVKNENANVGLNVQGQKQRQDQSQSNSSNNSNSVSGYGGSATGNGAGNTTEINVAAPVIPKPASNSAYVGDLPQLPQGSCRLFIGGGATNRDGSATGMIPIGNDQTCLSTRSLEVMKQINATVGQQVFGQADMLYVACQIEGMDKLAACKK